MTLVYARRHEKAPKKPSKVAKTSLVQRLLMTWSIMKPIRTPVWVLEGGTARPACAPKPEIIEDQFSLAFHTNTKQMPRSIHFA